MLSSWVFFFLWALLGVSRTQVEGAMPSTKGHPPTQLQYRGKRHYLSYGAAKRLENPVEIIASNITDENKSAAMSHNMNTAEPLSVTRPAISNWNRRKTLRTLVQQDLKMSILTQTVRETKGVSPPVANLEDFGTSVACRELTKGNICVRNTVQEILGDKQENGSSQLQQNQTHPRRVPVRPGYRPKPEPPNPYRPPSWDQPLKPYRPPLWYHPPKPKPKPDYNTGGSNNYNNPVKPSNNTNHRVSAHWTVSVPVFAGLLVVYHVS